MVFMNPPEKKRKKRKKRGKSEKRRKRGLMIFMDPSYKEREI
jgi:hypothetical protein